MRWPLPWLREVFCVLVVAPLVVMAACIVIGSVGGLVY
jgi:hypothetical protein